MLLNKINVAVKCRPVPTTEILEETMDFFHSDLNSVTTPRNKFYFKHIFTPKHTCTDIFERIIRPMLGKALLGFNGTVLAYGQTGSGKTYTLGTEVISHHEGITQMVLNHLFQIPGLRLKVSVLEIYLRDCYDLLHATPHKINIQGLKPVSVALQDTDNREKAMELLMSAVKNRRVGATASNKSSSRSHMIITLYIEISNNISKFNIVDLAGSEKIQASSGTLRNEGVAINEALLSLGRVVNCLAQAKSHIPFRDSPLTHLLEDSLNRDNYITLIGCINTLRKNVDETEKTLEFSTKFAGISASKAMIGTPFKTPSRFVNNTFTNGSGLFKKPLTPFNKTIATTPVNWGSKKQEQPQVKNSQRDTLNNSNVSLNLNLSNVSTSTAVLENSPPLGRMGSFSNASSDAFKAVTMTPADLGNYIQMTVDRAVNSMRKEISQIFKRQENVFNQQKSETFSNRLLDIADNYGTASGSSRADDSWSDSDLQTTVLGIEEISESEAPTCDSQFEPPSKMPKISSSHTKEIPSSNLNGSLYDIDSPTVQSEGVPVKQVNLEASSAFRRAPLRRSTRLSMMNNPFKRTPDRQDTDSNVDTTPPKSEVLKKPQIRMRCMRRSVLRRAFEESESYETSRGDSTDSSSAPDSHVFKKPQIRRYVRRTVLRTDQEGGSDESTDHRDSGLHTDAEVSKRPPRRSMRLSIKRPVESETDSPVKKERSSLRVSLLKTDSNYIGEKTTKPRGGKVTNRGNSASCASNISHEKRILMILQVGSGKDLLKLPTVGEKTAALILNDRLLRGPLKTVKDFATIRGVTTNQGQKFLWANSLI